VFADAWLSGWLAEISADLRENGSALEVVPRRCAIQIHDFTFYFTYIGRKSRNFIPCPLFKQALRIRSFVDCVLNMLTSIRAGIIWIVLSYCVWFHLQRSKVFCFAAFFIVFCLFVLPFTVNKVVCVFNDPRRNSAKMFSTWVTICWKKYYVKKLLSRFNANDNVNVDLYSE